MQVEDEVLRLQGGDPFSGVLTAAEAHRSEHGEGCGLYPAGPAVMALAATIVRCTGARRIVDLGTGLGYSALWLADAAPPDADVLAIDRFPEHVDAARRLAAGVGLDDRIRFVAAEAGDALAGLPSASATWFTTTPGSRTLRRTWR